jgi:hypothetical protein
MRPNQLSKSLSKASGLLFIGNKFLNNVEVSAQEAVFTLLQIPLHKASRDVIFVNTSSPEKKELSC